METDKIGLLEQRLEEFRRSQKSKVILLNAHYMNLLSRMPDGIVNRQELVPNEMLIVAWQEYKGIPVIFSKFISGAVVVKE
jgi:hypothetical protein